jgi:hypothetical protein
MGDSAGCYFSDEEIASMDAQHADVCNQLRATRMALYELVTAHNGYRHGVGPCICAAHEEARKLLGMGRDDAMPSDLRAQPQPAEPK